ncbi:MAG TPA: ATP-dependent helicase, partial [Chromatiaceae bacterium]|nr:ATP-dependent helicase [Chromatiaceae bacterium]
MNILHAFWLPETGTDFVQSGTLRLWCEADASATGARQSKSKRHPSQLPRSDWPALLDGLGLAGGQSATPPSPCQLRLPSIGARPLPCPEIAKAMPEPMELSGAEPGIWEVDTIVLERPIKQISDLHYLAAFAIDDLQPGSDFLFWYWFTQTLKQRLLRDQYLPALRWRQPPKPKGKRKLPAPELWSGWQWAAGDDDPLLATAAECMPAACA